MLRKHASTLVLILALCGLAYASEVYTVSGEFSFSKADVIILSLYTEQGFRNFKNSTLPPAPFTLKIVPTLEQKKIGKVPFKFFSIPEGTYCILAFRDINESQEPASCRHVNLHGDIASYKVRRFSGNWDEIKFKVDRNISGIKIEFIDSASRNK